MIDRTTTAELAWLVVLLVAVCGFVVVTTEPAEVPKTKVNCPVKALPDFDLDCVKVTT